MKIMVEKFKHYLGSHCSSSLMKDILYHHGLKVSEEICFGLGAGLGFVYRKAFNPPLYFVLGRSDDLEDKICYHLGGMAIPYVTDNNAQAWQHLKSMLDKGKPGLVNVDASYLQYLKDRFNLFKHVRYSGHRVLVTGYNETRGEACVIDYLWYKPQTVSLDDLEKARSSHDGQMPANNLLYTFLMPKVFLPLEKAIIQGIRMNVRVMLNPWVDLIGLPGVKKFCSRIMNWPCNMKEESIRENAYIVYMMLEAVGTGGGNFRRMYARFLREAAELLKDERLQAVFSIYARLGHLWKEVALLLKESSHDICKGMWENKSKNQLLLDEIASLEESGIMKLKEMYL